MSSFFIHPIFMKNLVKSLLAFFQIFLCTLYPNLLLLWVFQRVSMDLRSDWEMNWASEKKT